MFHHQAKGRERAHRIITGAGYKMGGDTIGRKEDQESDIKLIKKAVREHEDQEHGGKHAKLRLRDGGLADGGMAANRLDQTGRSPHSGKGKGKGHTNIEINVAPHPPGMGGPGTPPPPGMGAPPVGAAPPPMPPRPPMPAGGAPMGGPPPAMMGAARPPMPGMGGPMPPGAGGMPAGMPPRPMAKRGGRSESWGEDDAAANTSPEDEEKFAAQRHDMGDKRGGESRGRHARGGTTANRLADGEDEYCEGGRSHHAGGGRAGHEGGDNDAYDRHEMTAGAGGGRGRIEKAQRLGLPID